MTLSHVIVMYNCIFLLCVFFLTVDAVNGLHSGCRKSGVWSNGAMADGTRASACVLLARDVQKGGNMRVQ